MCKTMPMVPSYGSTMAGFSRVDSREVMWRRVFDDLGFEHARLSRSEAGWDVSGSVMMAEGGAPLLVEYRIGCDGDWRTRTVEVEQVWRGARRTLRLEHDGRGCWYRGGEEAAELAGCTDIDLGVTPSTNALAVNRLRLPVGAKDEILAAWVRFPEVGVTPAGQSYERLTERQYRYTSLASGFTALVEVDADGLPIDYAGVWHRVAEGPSTTPAPDLGFLGALRSDRASTELGDAGSDFGWLVGGWEAEVRDIDDDGRVHVGAGEWWFAWVLEGRAIQDVWISPPRGKRGAGMGHPEGANNRYGTTVRWFDRRAGLWRIIWVNPVTGVTNALAGKREGDAIVLLGEDRGGPIRWRFVDIRPDSFIWRGEVQDRQGAWRLDAEFRLRRIVERNPV
jgi:uncharacterized protein